MNDTEEEHVNEGENKQSLKESLDSCLTEKKSLETRVSEVRRERDEALSRLRGSERKVYTLSVVICIVAFGFTVAFSTRQAECHDNLGTTKDKVKAVEKANEQCMVGVSKCNSNLYDMKQQIKINQDKIQLINNDMLSTQNLLDECKGRKCIKEEALNVINDKLETCINDLNNSNSKNTKGGNNDKQPTKYDKKLKKCKTCQVDTENINKQGVHVLKGRVLQVIRVERPWRTARKDCQERGGDLLVPKNVDKLAEYLLEKEPENTNFWIGISDLENAEEFRGVNGGRVVGGWEEQNQIYRTQNPSHKHPGSDCVSMIYSDKTSGLAATHCDASMHYICDMAPGNINHDIFH